MWICSSPVRCSRHHARSTNTVHLYTISGARISVFLALGKVTSVLLNSGGAVLPQIRCHHVSQTRGGRPQKYRYVR